VIYSKEGETVYQTETVYNDETGLPVRQLTRLGGVLQSPPDDTPAQVLYDEQGRIIEKVWWDDNKEHRDKNKGPAVIKINPENGTHIIERYKNRGKNSRSRTEAAYIARDPNSGQIIRTAYYLDGIELQPSTKGLDRRPF